MNASRLVVGATRGAGLALVSDGVVGLAVPGQRQQTWATPRGLWRKGARKAFGDVVSSPAFAVAELAVGLAIIAIVPRAIDRS
ncbi:hypothetical protein [Demequina globuliformis]|uniref:hypothetical protein n=1 Tax=Demequina globuliformis TaxID=676202 RepID=UPI00128DB28B|nr:hypothetical protein [Demequina globuliformis]